MKIQYNEETYDADEVIEALAPHLQPERIERMQTTLSNRSRNFVPVMEKIFDQGNINAVLRSSESMGFQDVHIIENEKFRKANRVTKGSDKWLSIHRWQDTKSCFEKLKSDGYKIYVTHLDDNAKPIENFDWSQKSAIVYGSEGFGVSDEAIAMADATMIVPMQGFTQSYNISVAAAITMYHVLLERKSKLGKSGDLSEEEKKEVFAQYILASCNKTMDKVRETLVKG